jgi:hypothetical protein
MQHSPREEEPILLYLSGIYHNSNGLGAGVELLWTNCGATVDDLWTFPLPTIRRNKSLKGWKVQPLVEPDWSSIGPRLELDWSYDPDGYPQESSEVTVT